MLRKKIIGNKIKWKQCEDIIEYKSINDYKKWTCDAVAVDDIKGYLKSIGNEEDYVDIYEINK